MSLLKTILDFYIRSSLHVAVCFVGLFKIVALTGSYLVTDSLLIITFSAILVGYNLIKYGKLIWHSNSFRFKFLITIITTIFSFLGLYYLSKENYQVWLIILLIGTIGASYAIPWINNKTLRDYPAFKLLSVVICWVLLLFALPEYSSFSSKAIFTDDYGYNDRILWTQIVSISLFVYALCIPFEIRDLNYDHKNLQTLPQKIGVQKTKFLGVSLVIISFLIGWLGDYHAYFFPDLNIDLPFFMIAVITAISIWFSDKFKSDYYASFFVEAIPLLWLGLYFIF